MNHKQIQELFNNNEITYREKCKRLCDEAYVKPHQVLSRHCSTEDVPRIIHDVEIMMKFLTIPRGLHTAGALALAHSQFDDKEPLKFFIDRNECYVNPRIVTRIGMQKMCSEGCLSLPDTKPQNIMRHYKLVVEYQTIEDDDTLSEKKQKIVKQQEAQIWQHEIDHMHGKYVKKLDFLPGAQEIVL